MDTYKATNTRNGKFYIGSAINFEKRKKEHLNSTLNYLFQNALRKDPEAFEWEVWSDESEDRELEQALLDMWYGKEQCYNLSPYAVGGGHWVATGHCWVNDGTSERYIESGTEVEEGWELGRLPVRPETKQKMTEALKRREDNPFRKKGKESMSHGRIWVTTPDYSQERYLKPGEEIPEGWINGRSLKGKERPDHSENMKGRTWWVHPSGNRKFQKDSPGPEWQRGQVYRPDHGL